MRTAVYRHYDADGQVLYVGISEHPNRRLAEHISRSAWGHLIARVELSWFDGRDAAQDAERGLVGLLSPAFNRNTPPAGGRSGKTALSEWLKENDISQRKLAIWTGISTSFLCDICAGDKIPTVPVALRIEQATGGAVTMASWAGDQEPVAALIVKHSGAA